MKTIENQGFLTTSDAMGRSMLVKSPSSFTIANKINGFEHISYGMALNCFVRFNRWLTIRKKYVCCHFAATFELPVALAGRFNSEPESAQMTDDGEFKASPGRPARAGSWQWRRVMTGTGARRAALASPGQ
jgi:hypothetical protein